MSTLRLGPRQRFRTGIDWILIGSAVALSAIGVLTIWGASATDGQVGSLTGAARRQLQWVFIGLIFMTALVVTDYRWTRRFAWPLYAVLLVALAYLIIDGRKIHGAASWYLIRIGGFRFSAQPSEIGKVILVLILARYLSSRMLVFRKIWHVIIPLAIVGVPVALIFLQPDFGTAAIYLPTAFVLFFAAGIRKRVIVTFLLIGIAVAAAGYPHLKDYQKARVQTFLDPTADPLGKGYNVLQAQTALGSGGLIGKGWGQGTQTSFRFLPEFQTDFIFPALGEQFGFIGCMGVLGLFLILILRLAFLATQSEDLYGTLMLAGLATIFMVHLILNVGMAIGLLPVTGVPLPFFSYGGSFTLTCYIMIGLAVSASARLED